MLFWVTAITTKLQGHAPYHVTRDSHRAPGFLARDNHLPPESLVVVVHVRQTP